MSEESEILTIPGRWDISYEYAAGATASEFLRRLRDEQKICGVRCPGCARVILPPRGFCERCFVKTEDWVEVGTAGRIESFTISTEPFQGLPDPPYAIAYVTLDGASTAMVNFVREIDLSDIHGAAERLAVGTRVEVKWKNARQGRITDFYYVLSE